MSFQAQLAIFAWLPITLCLFLIFSPRTAILISYIGGFLFLPEQVVVVLPMIPDYGKPVSISYGILLGILFFDLPRLLAFRPSWIDLPIFVWCICPLFSSLSNDLGVYDGVVESFAQVGNWGFPYLVGRLYLNNLAGLRELAIAILKGGLLYLPLCLLELRLSPQLHNIFYGYYPFGFITTLREGGGWRPVVFLQHGLALAVWMMAATLISLWLWQSGTLKSVWDMPINWLTVALLVTFISLRSIGSYFYMLYGGFILLYGRFILFLIKSFRLKIPFLLLVIVRQKIPLLLLVIVISLYSYIGASGFLNTDKIDRIVAIADQVTGAERAASLQTRLDNEKMLSEKARERPLFGWGGWGRNRIIIEDIQGDLKDISVTDSFWILQFGTLGAVGLIAGLSTFLLPVLVFWWRYPAFSWFNPQVAPAAVLAVIAATYMWDSLLNAHTNPIYTLAAGGLAGLVLKRPQLTKASKAASPSKSNYILRQQRRRKIKQSQSPSTAEE